MSNPIIGLAIINGEKLEVEALDGKTVVNAVDPPKNGILEIWYKHAVTGTAIKSLWNWNTIVQVVVGESPGVLIPPKGAVPIGLSGKSN